MKWATITRSLLGSVILAAIGAAFALSGIRDVDAKAQVVDFVWCEVDAKNHTINVSFRVIDDGENPVHTKFSAELRIDGVKVGEFTDQTIEYTFSSQITVAAHQHPHDVVLRDFVGSASPPTIEPVDVVGQESCAVGGIAGLTGGDGAPQRGTNSTSDRPLELPLAAGAALAFVASVGGWYLYKRRQAG